jgi:hypothetical protein
MTSRNRDRRPGRRVIGQQAVATPIQRREVVEVARQGSQLVTTPPSLASVLEGTGQVNVSGGGSQITLSDLSEHTGGDGLSNRCGSKIERTKSYQGVSVALFAKNLFVKKKFILNEGELEYSVDKKNSICYQCLTALNMDVEKSRVFWEEHKHVVSSEISNKRSNVAYAMRREWFSK